MHRRQGLRLLAASSAATFLLTACGSSKVSVTKAEKAANPLCAKVAQHWPQKVAGQEQRDVSTSGGTEAAWGDPAIIARCGVTSPGADEHCVDANGVDWVYSELSDGAGFVTFGREPAIQVLVPSDYAGDAIGAFAAAAKQIPQGNRKCS